MSCNIRKRRSQVCEEYKGKKDRYDKRRPCSQFVKAEGNELFVCQFIERKPIQ